MSLRATLPWVTAVLLVSACQCGEPAPQPGGEDAGSSGPDSGGTGGPGASNDGTCGTTCGRANQYCVAGVCTTCPTDLVACGTGCVDIASNNAHCGRCGNPCPAGEGCNTRSCIPTLTTGSGPSTCPASGTTPQLVVLPDAGTVCSGMLAQTTFRWGLCSCDTIQLFATLTTDGFDSSKGPYTPGQSGGAVGANGRYTTTAGTDVGGTLWTADPLGFTTTGVCRAREELHVNGPVLAQAPTTVGLNARVNGNVSTSASVTVGQTLFVPQSATVASGVTAASVVRGAVTVPSPCDCADSLIIPVADIVAARANQNDNATIGLSRDALVNVTARSRLDLPCGHYYLSSIRSSIGLTIVAHGRTILYVNGDVVSSGALAITLDPDAELDVFIAGKLESSADLTLGNPTYPARMRVYLASSQPFTMSAQLKLGAFLYAPRTPITSSATLNAFGGIVAGRFTASGLTNLHYDKGVLFVGEDCANPPTLEPDAGRPPTACTTCNDCGNQACIDGQCGKCTSNDQCCAPLLCLATGFCGTSEF